MNSFFKKVILFISLTFIDNSYALNEKNPLSYINTKNITYNESEGIIELGKDSLININDTNILTNKGIINYPKNRIEIFGSFYIYEGLNILTGDYLISDINFENLKINSVNYIFNNDLKIDSKNLEKTNNNIIFYNSFLTPCIINGYFNCPTWSLKIKKTNYDIKKDKFTHFNSFLQIADKKIFYLPYFTHYGAKAPRQSGFLTPSVGFNFIGSDTSFKLPYYLPLNISTDLTISPILYFNIGNNELIDAYDINTLLKNKNSMGNINLDLFTEKNKNQNNVNNSFKINGKQTVNKFNILEFSSLLTNSISSARSINDDQLPFESAYIKLSSFDILTNDDLLISSINTVTSFDNINNELVPIELPSLRYSNNLKLTNNVTNYNNIELSYLKRERSDSISASENKNLMVETIFTNNSKVNELEYLNKFIIKNNYNSLTFSQNNDLNLNNNQTNASYSTEISVTNNYIKPRMKFIINEDFGTSSNYNEDSHSITFNYHSLFNENRFFGNNLSDKSKRIAYGIEFKEKLFNKNTKVNIGQSYKIDSNDLFENMIMQSNKLSDIAVNSQIKNDFLILNVDGRFDQASLELKETNISTTLSNPIEFGFIYNQTKEEAYQYSSSDSRQLKLFSGFDLNNNIKFKTSTAYDIDNKNIYKNAIAITVFDECSELDIAYVNSKFNDNLNTKPYETISVTYKMDYLGFFGYEQSTNLFFEEIGLFNYGL